VWKKKKMKRRRKETRCVNKKGSVDNKGENVGERKEEKGAMKTQIEKYRRKK
jgi:hypothetical protein